MPFAETWIDLEITTLSEISQTEKDKYMILLIWNKKKHAVEFVYKIEIYSET